MPQNPMLNLGRTVCTMKKNKSYFPFPSLTKNHLPQYILNSTGVKYSGIIENSLHSFFSFGIDGGILESNDAATAVFGYSPAEFRTLKIWNIIDLVNSISIPAIQQCEKNGFATTEATGIKKNGEYFPVEITSAFFKDSKGVDNTCCMISDLSIPKKTEAAMRLSKERYDLVIKATKDLVWDWDLVTGEIYRNDSSLFDVYGLRSNDSIKNIQDWSNFIHPLDKEKITALIDHYINSAEETDFDFEYRFRKEDGTYAYICDKGYIIRNTQGKAIRMIGAAQNITERKQTELAIKESEQRYKNFVQRSTEGIWRIELNEILNITAPLEEMIEHCFTNAFIAECNDAYAQMYGFTKAADLINIPLQKLWPKENAVSVQYMTGFIKNGFKATEEISYEFNRNGEQVIFMNTMVGIVEGDFLKRVWGTRRDITDQVKTEKALAESENHLRTIIQTNPECIKLLDKEGMILEMNPAGLAILEANSLDQVIGKNVFNLILPAYREAFKKLIRDVFKGNAAELEFEITGLTGKHCFMETHCVPLKDAKNNITALLAVTRDITERKNAEALLLASEERYRYLFNNSPSSIIIWDMDDYRIVEVNESSIQLYGYTREEFLQKTVLDIRATREHPKMAILVEEAGKADDFKKSILCETHTKNGARLFMDITAYKIVYNGKHVILTQGNNVSEKIQLENSLNEERKIRQQQITGAVIAGQEKERTEIGEELHDNINQILASTKLYIECSLKDTNPRRDLVMESKLLLEKAMKEIRKLSKSLLPPSLGEIGLLQALHELVENMKQVNELAISIDWNDTEENEISAKLKLTIFRIVQEQLNNVIKHADAKNVIISIKKEGPQIQLGVKDDGQGFDTSLKRIGVGLRNISSRAEVNNGTVCIISGPGEGCDLIVTFSETPFLKNSILPV
jgi:PAS domain S-box-containing protein